MNNQSVSILTDKSEIFYRSIVDHSIAAIFLSSPETGGIYFANPAACRIFGYTKNEFLNLNRESVFVADTALQKGMEERKATGKFSGILTAIRKNGEKFLCEASSVFFTDTNGMIKASTTLIDISGRKNAEEELKQINERYKLATRASFDAIWDADLVKQTINWGEGFKTLFGYKVGDHPTGASLWEDNIHPDDRERVITKHNKILNDLPEQNFWSDEYRFVKADSSLAHVIDRGLIIRDKNGRAIRVIGAMQDITALKLKEEELIKTNNRFYTASQATSDIIWDWDIETNNVEWSDSFTLIMGHKLPPGSKLPLEFCIGNFHPDDRQRILESLQKAIEDPMQIKWTTEFRYLRADGSFAEVKDRGIIIRDADGKALHMIGAMQDITDLKMKEQKLINQEIQKQKAISQAIIDTQEKERTEIGKELHDNVNQILTTTKLYLDMAASDPVKQSEFIKKSSANILYVMNEISKLSRSILLPSLGDIGLLDSITDLTESIKLTQELQVDFTADPDIELILSDNQKLILYRIIQEATNNIIKFARAKSILIHLSICKNEIELVISDDGIGFNPAEIIKGSGLKNIQNRVYLFNGTFEISSSPGKGCELLIIIPLQKASSD